MIYKGLLSAILLIVFPNLVNSNPNDRQSHPKAVVLDVKKNSGTEYTYDRKDKVETFTPKEGYLFSGVKQGTKDVWKASDSNEYANKVVLNGKGDGKKTVTLHLVNNTQKTVHKSGKNKPWEGQSTDQNDGSHNFHSEYGSNSQFGLQYGGSTDYKSGTRSGAHVGSGGHGVPGKPGNHSGGMHGAPCQHGNFGAGMGGSTPGFGVPGAPCQHGNFAQGMGAGFPASGEFHGGMEGGFPVLCHGNVEGMHGGSHDYGSNQYLKDKDGHGRLRGSGGHSQPGTFPAHGGCGHGTHGHHGNFGGHGNVPGHSAYGSKHKDRGPHGGMQRHSGGSGQPAYGECMDGQLCEKKRKEMAAQKDHAGCDSFQGYGCKDSGSYYDKHGSNEPSKDRAGHGTMHSEPGVFESYDDSGTKDPHQRTLVGEGDEDVEYDQEGVEFVDD